VHSFPDLSAYYTRSSDKKFLCLNCNLSTMSKRDLLRHIDAVHLDTVYTCLYCKKNLKAHHLLERHVRKVHVRAHVPY
jgi:transcription elongation factor Elf1